MRHLLDLNYWFNLRPETLSSVGQALFIILLAIFLVTIIVIFIAKKKMGIYRGFFKRISDFCVGNLIIGGTLLFFNYEIIPFFSARFWLAIWAIVMIVWKYFILKTLKKIKLDRNDKGKEDQFKKYLP